MKIDSSELYLLLIKWGITDNDVIEKVLLALEEYDNNHTYDGLFTNTDVKDALRLRERLKEYDFLFISDDECQKVLQVVNDRILPEIAIHYVVLCEVIDELIQKNELNYSFYSDKLLKNEE